MKRIAVILLALVAMAIPVRARAYTQGDYEVTDDNMFCVDEFHGLSNHVTMYLVQPNSIEYTSNVFKYEFECTEGVFEYEGDGGTFDCGALLAVCMAENKEVVEEADGYEITKWRFGVEDGKYCFARPMGLNGVYTLPSSLESPWDSVWFTSPEPVSLSGGADMRIYVMNGPEEWARELYPEFKDWALKIEANYVEKAKRTALSTESISVEAAEGGRPEEGQEIDANEEAAQDAQGGTPVMEEAAPPKPVPQYLKAALGVLGLLAAVIITKKVLG